MTEAGEATTGEAAINVSLDGDPHVVLGRRKGKKIEAVRLEVHSDLFDEIRTVCQSALRSYESTQGRPYEPYTELERGEEHFLLPVAEIHEIADHARQVVGADQSRTQSAQASTTNGIGVGTAESESEGVALLSALENPGQLSAIQRDDFLAFAPLFYAVAWQQSDGTWVSFLRKTNPRQFFKPGRRWWQYGDTLKRIPTDPTFVFEDYMDVIVGPRVLVGFSPVVLKTLFTDVKLAQSDVPKYVADASEAISEQIPLSERSLAALNAAGRRKVSVSSRLVGLAARIAELKESGGLTQERYREVVRDDESAAALLGEDGTFDFDEEGAGVFLDVLEGRYFEDGWTGSPRRADRFSRRS